MAWIPDRYPLWHSSAPMSYILRANGPAEWFVRGDGSWLEDAGGRRFLDARAGMSNMLLGYGRADIAEAMFRQALALPYAPALRHDRPAATTVRYAYALTDVAPPGLTRVRLSHTGSSAVECALHMARRFHRNLDRPEKRWIVSLADSYHGSTLMSMAASGQPELHEMFSPMPDGFAYVPPPDPAACDACGGRSRTAGRSCLDQMFARIGEIGTDHTAAVVIELVANQRAVALPAHYVRDLRDYCTRHDILLVVDEVYTGFGRTGPMFASELYGLEPDIMCLSKGITAGYAPLAAVLATDRVYAAFDMSGKPYFAHGSTTDGHPVSCAAGLAVLDAYARENVLARGRSMGELLARNLTQHLADCPAAGRVLGCGACVAINVVDGDGRPAGLPAMRRIAAGCLRRGVLVDYTRHVLSVVPPLTLIPGEVDLVVDTLGEVLFRLEESHVDDAEYRPPSVGGRR